jgi:hypothetical protein
VAAVFLREIQARFPEPVAAQEWEYLPEAGLVDLRVEASLPLWRLEHPKGPPAGLHV